MANIRVDASEHPIVLLTFPRVMQLEDLDVLDPTILELVRTRGPIITVAHFPDLDLRTVTAAYRKRMAEGADRVAEEGGLVVEIVVLPSALYRAMFTAYAWMRAHKTHPQLAFATLEEAYAEARAWAPRASEPGAASEPR
ncbi:MAG: hypothetical protein U0230_19775 [Polyangiales bacterium]